ncbi:hypothetical protein Glove_40g144 [Diversispora epigaea]|uniref:Uncharacterized protein n=1 Tax=Diversispora epigaea TaxID=1348612 RepID=A0A397JFH2_9GLOM|nr:hypothetical protein Glove_40g144 [Diversispora epigaea]
MTKDNNNSRDSSKNMCQGTSPAIEIDYDEELTNLTQRQLKSHVVNINGKDIECILDSGRQCLIITCEKAKELGLEINSVKARIIQGQRVTLKNHITDRAVSGIVKQVSVANPDISRRKRTPCKALPSHSLNSKPDYKHCDNWFSGIYKSTMDKQSEMNCQGKKIILNDTTSPSSSSFSSEPDSEFDIKISE